MLIAALFAGQDGTSGQGSAAVPLLIGGLLLSLAGWDPAPPIADAGKAAQDRVRPAMERCLTLVRQQAGRQPSELITACLDDLRVFTEGQRGLDDLSLLAIRRRV